MNSQFLAADGDAAQRALCAIVGQAHPAIFEESGEGWPALQHVIDGAGEVLTARQPRSLRFESNLQRGDERRATLLACCASFIRRAAVDGPLDPEQRIDAPDALDRDRRECRLIAPASGPCTCLDIRHGEERPPGMTGIAVGPQNPAVMPQMLCGCSAVR